MKKNAFLLLSENLEIEPELLDAIAVFCDVSRREDVDYLIANVENAAEIYAPEVNLFIKKSRSDTGTKAKILRAIYESRLTRLELGGSAKIDYDPSLCQYHEKLSGGCALCVEVCEPKAIVKDDENHRLKYAGDLCDECGKCAGICPTGAIDFGSYPRAAIYETARICADFTPLLIEEKSIAPFDRPIPPNAAPIAVPNAAMLGAAELLALAQESGSQIVIDAEESAAARFANDLFEKIYGESAVLPIEKLDEARKISVFKFGAGLSAANRRSALAARMENMVGGGDFGTAEGELFGTIAIDGERCTLCAACAAACVTEALRASESDGVLFATDSLCAMCGECEAICPEKAIVLSRGKAALNKRWFERREAARDEAFRCVECGRPFAASKSIAKAIAFMSPMFASDPDKLRSLSCCPECKPKVMIKSILRAEK